MSSAAVALVLVSCLTHALWNLVSKRSGSTPAFFLLGNLCPLALLPLFVALGGLDVVRSAPPLLWGLLAATGACQACYFAALARAYRHGEISLVYPLARTFPVFVVLLAGFGLGQWPTPQAWLGFAGVVLGCLLLPLGQGAPTGRLYLNAAAFWALVAALGSAGYTVVDSLGVELVASLSGPLAGPRGGAAAALVYGWLEWVSTSLFLLLVVLPTGGRAELTRVMREEWRPALIVGAMAFATYLLILWAYTLAEKVAYVAALRQLSIVFGVLLGIRLLGERGGAGRLAGSAVIVAGLALIALAD